MKKTLIIMLLIASLLFPSFSTVKAAEDITFDSSKVTISGSLGGVVIITNNTNKMKVIKCKCEGATEYGPFNNGIVGNDQFIMVPAKSSIESEVTGYIDWRAHSLTSVKFIITEDKPVTDSSADIPGSFLYSDYFTGVKLHSLKYDNGWGPVEVNQIGLTFKKDISEIKKQNIEVEATDIYNHKETGSISYKSELSSNEIEVGFGTAIDSMILRGECKNLTFFTRGTSSISFLECIITEISSNITIRVVNNATVKCDSVDININGGEVIATGKSVNAKSSETETIILPSPLKSINLDACKISSINKLTGPTQIDETICWPLVTFGKYKINSDEYEPINWRVLKVDGNYAIIMSDKAIIDLPYTSSWSEGTWEKSYAREYLNNDFINEAFTDEEKNAIAESTIETKKLDGASNDSKIGVKDQNPTQDKIYILALNDLKEYKMYNGTGSEVPTRQIELSNQVKKSLNTDKKYADYFLRNNGYYSYDVAGVSSRGKVSASGWRVYNHATVVPVMKVRTDAITDAEKIATRNIVDYTEEEATVIKKVVVGEKYKVNKVTYSVTSVAEDKVIGGGTPINTVSVSSVNKGLKTITIPKKVKIDGISFTVTGIKKNAFKNSKSTLKTIKINADQLNKVDKNAFTGLKSSTTVKTNGKSYNTVKKAVNNRNLKLKK